MTTEWERPRHPVPAEPPRATDWWRVFGIVLVVVIAVGGLAFVAAAVLFVVAMGSYGSNK